MLGKLGVWITGLFGLAAIAVVGWFVFEAVSRWPSDPAVKPPVVAEMAFRRCPAVVTAAPRPAGQPVDDLGGLRPGLSKQDAKNILQCLAGDFTIRDTVEAFELPARPRQVHDMIVAAKDGLTWRLGLFGPKGQETIAIVRREATYSPSRAPTIADVEAELLRHFGPAHEARSPVQGGRELTWTFLKSGKPVRVAPVEGSATYLFDLAAYMAAGFHQSDCAKNAKLDPAAAPTYDVRCGVTIRVGFDPAQHDKTRFWRLRQVIVDQQRLSAAFNPGG